MKKATVSRGDAPGVLPPPLDPVGLVEGALQAGFSHWQGARRKGLAMALLGLIGASSVNLTKVARACAGPAQVGSHYRRLQRLLSGFAPLVSDGSLARRVAAWLGDLGPWVVSVDRTEWKPVRVAGPCLLWVNFLVLGIVKDGVTYPLVWTRLPRRGSSTGAERLALLDRFLALFGPQAVRFLTMDREFYGREWLEGLHAQGGEFPPAALRRAPRDQRPRGTDARAATLRPPGPGGQAERWSGRRLWGKAVDVAVVRIPPEVGARTQAQKRAQGHGCPGDELVVVVAPADRPPNDPPDHSDVLTDDRRRWSIETLFGALKSRGFDLEATQVVSCPERLERLVGLLALAFTWAHRTGQWVAEHVHAPRFNVRQGRRAKSLFRHGLDHLCHLLAPGAAADPVRQEHFRQLIQLLSCA